MTSPQHAVARVSLRLTSLPLSLRVYFTTAVSRRIYRWSSNGRYGSCHCVCPFHSSVATWQAACDQTFFTKSSTMCWWLSDILYHYGRITIVHHRDRRQTTGVELRRWNNNIDNIAFTSVRFLHLEAFICNFDALYITWPELPNC